MFRARVPQVRGSDPAGRRLGSGINDLSLSARSDAATDFASIMSAIAHDACTSKTCTVTDAQIAVEGCSHGELDAIYNDLLSNERETGRRVDVLLLCGDVQTMRNAADLHSLAVPPKYRRLGDFHHYYAGTKHAPILTIVIGGNHEASNYLWELYYGGWLAPNIYYLGAAGCVNVGGLSVAGASGIYKPHDYTRGHFERYPYSASDMRSTYHTRQFEITKLGLLSRPDIFLSHDWPNCVEQHGDVAELLRRKPFFRAEIESSTLGSPPLQALLYDLQPRYWFAAHLHVHFTACIKHAFVNKIQGASMVAPSDTASTESSDVSTLETPNNDFQIPAKNYTEFHALSKCTSKGDYLHIFDLPAPSDAVLAQDTSVRPQIPLSFNTEWLAITRVLQPYFSLHRAQRTLPPPTDTTLRVLVEQEKAQLTARLGQTDGPSLCIRRTQTFAPTAPPQTKEETTESIPGGST